MRELLKRSAKINDHSIRNVHVIGAGTMGGDIAAWCAYKGYRVTLQDQEATRLSKAISRANSLYQKKYKNPRLAQAAMDRLIPDVAGNGVESADLIIEAVFEELSLKQTIFKELEQRAKSTCLFASNTSSIPLEEIANCLSDKQRLVGIHFFNPVSQMPLVEVVRGQATSVECFDRACAFVNTLDKLPLPVKSSPGFLVNRVLMPYLLQAVQLFEEGVPLTVIDKVAMDFGMPMGPVTLADTVGLDVCLHVAKQLTQHFGGAVPAILEQKVAQGKLGVKSGEGFYRYDKKGQKKSVKTPSAIHSSYADVQDRLILLMVHESMLCLQEGVVETTDQLNAGMIFGAGFAPHTGGPLTYARERGVQEILLRLRVLQDQYGKAFLSAVINE